MFSPSEARDLLDSIDLKKPSGLRARALLATLAYSFARVGAMVGMNVEDYYQQGKRWWLRLHDKGGSFHQVPAHHNAEAYLEVAGIWNEKGTPLWRSMTRDGTFIRTPGTALPIYRALPRGGTISGRPSAEGGSQKDGYDDCDQKHESHLGAKAYQGPHSKPAQTSLSAQSR